MDPNTDPRALAAQNTFSQALKERLLQTLLGQGMTQNAAQAMQGRPEYLQYLQLQQSQGMQPMPYEQWLQQQQPQQPRGLLSR